MKELRGKNTSLATTAISREEKKEALQESINKYLETIENQIGDLKKVGQNALVIGGVIVAAYALTELLLPEPSRKNDVEPLPIKERDEDEGESIVWSALKGAATTLLLTVARQKLVDLIEHLTNQDAAADS